MNNNYEKTITILLLYYYKKLEIYWKIGKFLLNLN